MNEKKRMKQLRKAIGFYSWLLIAYYMLLNYSVSMAASIQLVVNGFQAVISADSWEAYAEGVNQGALFVMENGWGYLAACAAGVIAIVLWKGRGYFRELFATKQTMQGRTLVRLLCIFLSGQLVFQLVAIVEELILNRFGLSLLESIEMASAGSDSFSMFLYMGLAAPVVEEILFRGVLMRGLEPYGRRFAIVASSILFGAFHGNLVQSPYAFAVGLVLGYTAMEYSIGWAMVLHMVNNLVLGDSLQRLTASWPMGAADLMFWCIYLVCGIVSARLMWRQRDKIRLWLRDNPCSKNAMRAFCTAPGSIVLFLMMGANAALMLFI